jgi:hypothetical protein
VPDIFQYRARDAHGALVAGKLRSADREGVFRYLDDQQLIPVDVDKARPSITESLSKLFHRGPGLETRCTPPVSPSCARFPCSPSRNATRTFARS